MRIESHMLMHWDPQVNSHSSTLFKLSYRNCPTMASSNQKSSSSSTSIHKYTFEVLLSFRGEDTHYTFLDRLCETLDQIRNDNETSLG